MVRTVTGSAENRTGIDYGSRYAVRAAIRAPSIHNTQPWYFIGGAEGIGLYADMSRALTRTDQDGRELLISCGAALFNLRLAMRHLGFAADVRMLPEPRHHDLIAEVRWGRYRPPTAQEEWLFRAIPLRHTHRGPFRPSPAQPLLLPRLVRAVRDERADLVIVDDPQRRHLLAALTRSAESVHRTDPFSAAELAQWTPPPGSPRRDGVPPGAYPRFPDAGPLAGRDFGGRMTRGVRETNGQSRTHGLGTLLVLATRADRPLDWLLAGRALQRLLLSAAAHHLSAAYHTQALELPGRRERVRTDVTGGVYPQMVLRLGHPDQLRRTPRRAVGEVLRLRTRHAA